MTAFSSNTSRLGTSSIHLRRVNLIEDESQVVPQPPPLPNPAHQSLLTVLGRKSACVVCNVNAERFVPEGSFPPYPPSPRPLPAPRLTYCTASKLRSIPTGLALHSITRNYSNDASLSYGFVRLIWICFLLIGCRDWRPDLGWPADVLFALLKDRMGLSSVQSRSLSAIRKFKIIKSHH